MVTYYSDGSQDREYIGTICSNCEQTRVFRDNSRNQFSVRCDDGSGGGGGGGGAATVFRNVFSWPSSAKAVITKIQGTNSSFHANVINTGLLILSNLSVNYDFDLVTKALDSKSVTTYIEDGIVIGTWTQTGVSTVYISGDKIYFTITGTTTTSLPHIPFPVITSYTIKVEHNLITNIVNFDNISSSSQGVNHGSGIENN